MRHLRSHPTSSPTQNRRPPAHPPGPAYPCCLPALGGFVGWTPREGSAPESNGGRRHRASTIHGIACSAEDSHSGRVRTLGKRVGGNSSRVQIPHPPPNQSRKPYFGSRYCVVLSFRSRKDN